MDAMDWLLFFSLLMLKDNFAPPLGLLKISAGICSRFANGVADADKITVCGFAPLSPLYSLLSPAPYVTLFSSWTINLIPFKPH